MRKVPETTQFGHSDEDLGSSIIGLGASEGSSSVLTKEIFKHLDLAGGFVIGVCSV